MKPLSSLFLAGLCAATFSGCYMDRQPTMTLEDRAMASDREIAEYEAKKTAEGSKKSESVESKLVASRPTGEIDSLISPAARQFCVFDGQKIMAGTWSISSGRNVVNLEVWVHSDSSGWQKIVSARLDAKGPERLVLDEKTGFVILLAKKNGVEAEREVFRYDLNMARW